MKIIDGKGRLFGKINVIDFMVIVFILSFLPIVYYGYRIINTKPKAFDKECVSTKIKCIGLISEVAQIMKEGDMGVSSTLDEKGVLGEIINIEDTDVLTLNMTTASIQYMLAFPRKDVTARIELLCTEKNGVLYYSENPVKVGNSIIFSTKLYDAQGTILDVIRE